MAVSNGQTTAIEMKMRLREKPLSELMEEFEKLSSTPDCDVDLLCAYLEVLEEKSPVLPDDRSPAAEYEKFRESHAELFDAPETAVPEEVSRKRRSFPLKRLLVSFAAVFCLLVLVADANGAGVIDRLIEWGTEVFSLRPASGSMELATADENGFRSLQDALAAYGIENPAIPTWIPSQFSIDQVSIFEVNDTIAIGGKYTSDNGDFYIRVNIGFEDTFTFEDNQVKGATVYETNGIPFIISINFEKRRATWNINGHMYGISGDITEGELKEMLDSIQIKE